MRAWGLMAMMVVPACAGDGHPDTGIGSNAAVPAQIDCSSFCTRAADCVVRLCDEDKDTTRYAALREDFIDDCNLNCENDKLRAQISPTAWKCAFTETCRSVFEHDVCDVEASYTCK